VSEGVGRGIDVVTGERGETVRARSGDIFVREDAEGETSTAGLEKLKFADDEEEVTCGVEAAAWDGATG